MIFHITVGFHDDSPLRDDKVTLIEKLPADVSIESFKGILESATAEMDRTAEVNFEWLDEGIYVRNGVVELKLVDYDSTTLEYPLQFVRDFYKVILKKFEE